MTDSEAKARAVRIIKCITIDSPIVTEWLIEEIAHEFQRIAIESGWQKERVRELENERNYNSSGQ